MISIPIIYYHSVGLKNPYWNRSFLTLEYLKFEKQLKYISRHYNVITLKDYYNIITGNIPPIKNAIVLTLDDGYLDNWIWAFPLLKKYNLPATIFVSPEFVDTNNEIRPNLDDYMCGNVSFDELKRWGFLSWNEMREMEKSGIIDIQSHTMTHTKYFVSDKIVDFHYPGADSLYEIGNQNIQKKPYYIEDSLFEKLIPYGYPIFESKSSVIARKAVINPEFISNVLSLLSNYNFNNYNKDDCFKLIEQTYNDFRKRDLIIDSIETDDDYYKRLKYEIIESKRLIEVNLNKKIEFLCWPHGDNNIEAHNMAIEAGYLMTTIGKANKGTINFKERISERIGINNSNYYFFLKSKFKIKALAGIFPYASILNSYRKW